MCPPRHWALLLVLAAALVVVIAVPATAAMEWSWSAADDEDTCWGSPEECPVVYDLDADDGDGAAGVGRRRLQYYYDVNTAAAPQPAEGARYISYSALMRDSVPCSVPGASYYNCQPGTEANPYTRGCNAITQCRE